MTSRSPEAWREKGSFVEVPEGKVFVVELGAESDAVPVLVLHGFPTSSWDFVDVATLLSARRRVVLFDFVGFGYSSKPADHGYGLFEQADVATLVARARGITRAHVVAHDMGTSVATELCARRERGLLPFAMESLTLLNGSVHIEMASLTLGQRILRSPLGDLFSRVSTQRVFVAQMKRIFGRPAVEADLDAMWRLLARDDGARRLPAIIGYIAERTRFRRRWIGALERLDVPALVAWGKRDPVCAMAIAEQLAREIRGAELTVWDDLGHYPQVEAPEVVAGVIDAFLQRVEQRGAALPRTRSSRSP